MEIIIASEENYNEMLENIDNNSLDMVAARCDCMCSCANCGKCGCSCICTGGKCNCPRIVPIAEDFNSSILSDFFE